MHWFSYHMVCENNVLLLFRKHVYIYIYQVFQLKLSDNNHISFVFYHLGLILWIYEHEVNNRHICPEKNTAREDLLFYHNFLLEKFSRKLQNRNRYRFGKFIYLRKKNFKFKLQGHLNTILRCKTSLKWEVMFDFYEIFSIYLYWNSLFCFSHIYFLM
jgi:hypothetical protein